MLDVSREKTLREHRISPTGVYRALPGQRSDLKPTTNEEKRHDHKKY